MMQPKTPPSLHLLRQAPLQFSNVSTITMGCNSSKERREDMKEGVKEVAHELPENLKAGYNTQGSVTMAGYDPDKTSEENAHYHVDKKPINEKIHHILKNDYPDESITLGGVEPEGIKKDDDGRDM